jgi:hypothetical protein
VRSLRACGHFGCDGVSSVGVDGKCAELVELFHAEVVGFALVVGIVAGIWKTITSGAVLADAYR